ncbi:Zinc finger MIZ domain-containing protein 2 [Madurella fahalii]|uniref:Zinc finger MIZ domain-containing protein 2 n=1 Tax=Madurella fahalii TaxID=1157608 RepID=A0ABQ0GBT1_9PEZI
MPPSHPSAGANPRPATAGQHIQIASSNATANAFLGGRQPAWMTAGGVRKPPSRPGATRPPALQAAQQQPAQAVLPSPAPSDEPSPALSSTLDSPNTIPASLPDAQNMTPTAAPSTALALPVTEARFVVEPVTDGPDVQDMARSGPVGPDPVAHNHAPPLVNRPLQPLSDGIQAGQDGERGGSSLDGAPPPSVARVSLPPFKRRRTDQSSTSSPSNPLLAAIDSHVQAFGGDLALEPTIERPRMMLLREACKHNDLFFIVLHQLFSVWSQNPQDAHPAIPQNPLTINTAFAILEMILKKNQAVSAAHQRWFAQFPFPIGSDQWKAGPATKVDQVAAFLGKLVREHEPLSLLTLNRGYPYLVDELHTRLECYSPVLQMILFTACRRRLGVPDGDLGQQIEQAFRDDQGRHRSEFTGQQVRAPITQPGEIDYRNANLINLYRQIVGTAASRASARQSLQNPPVQQASVADRPAFTPYPTAAPFPNTYPNPGVQVPSHGTMLAHPYTAHPGLNGTAAMQTGSSSGPQMPAQYQTVGVGGSGAQPPSILAQYQAQYQAYQQQMMFHAQQLNQQQYLQHPQAMGSYPTQPGHSAASQARHGVTQQPTGQHIQQMQQIQQVQPTGYQRPLRPAPRGLAPGPLQAPNIPPAPQIHRAVLQPQRLPQVKDPLFPPRKHIITRPEWPYDPSDKKAIMMSLHQAHVRSPKRVMRDGETERFYQAVKSLPVKPTPIPPKNTIYEFRFEVTEEQLALAAAKSNQGGLVPVIEHFNGALRWRVRCCVVRNSPKPPAEDQWVTLDVNWPSNIFMTLNQHALDIRRQAHNGRDLATEITGFIVCGTNVLKIGIPEPKPGGAQNRFVAVEMLETLSHSKIVDMIWASGVIPEEETLRIIKERLTSSSDDEVAFEAPDLSIDLADPFSSTIFKIPARGAHCTHMECFDLEIWLNTRPSKPTIKCPHGQVKCDCKTGEPSSPDKWRCPICSKDARPYSLRIDGFLLKVRAQLEEEEKLHTKCMHVKPDGTWSVILEDDDDGGSDAEEGPPPKRNNGKAPAGHPSAANNTTATAAAAAGRRQEVEIIEID